MKNIFMNFSHKLTFILSLNLIFAMGKVIELTVICEKVMKDDSIKLAEFLVKSALKEYSYYFSKSNIEFRLERILDFERYSKLKEFSEFSLSVGESDIWKRKLRLSDVSKNLIILYSSVSKINEKQELKDSYRFRSLTPCEGRYFKNIGNVILTEDVLTSVIKAVKEWIEFTFQVKLPDVMKERYEGKFFHLKEQVLNNLRKCNGDNKFVSLSSMTDSEDKTNVNPKIKENIESLNKVNKNKKRALESESNLELQNDNEEKKLNDFSNIKSRYTYFNNLNKIANLEENSILPKKFKLPYKPKFR